MMAFSLLASATALAKPLLRVSSTRPKPGDPVLVTVLGVGEKPQGTAAGAALVFFPVRGGWQAVFAVPLDDPPAEVKVLVEGTPPLRETLAIRAHTFPEEEITVAPELAEPPPDRQREVDADNAAVIQAARHATPPRFSAGFRRRAAAGPTTSPFGAWRTFNGRFRSRHLGLDTAAASGVPVRAVQDGTVTLVRAGYLIGGTVVVAHGAGITSTYFHLSDITVAAGDEVKRGAVVGKVGLTGRATGPHVHLGIWVPDGFVDPAVFLGLRLGPPRAAAGQARRAP